MADGACVSDQANAVCGAGTILVGTACVPVDAGAGDGQDQSADALDASADADVAPTDAVDAAADVSPPCLKQCTGHDCGDDGCGGSCGSCSDPAKPYCDDSVGKCVGKCVPQCLGKDCGDDGCGATCGTCAGGLACTAIGRCVPGTWTCALAAYNAGADPCNCGCGAPDPDCKNAKNPIAGCSTLESCDASGKCVAKAPAAWTCSAAKYAGLDTCDCGCGAHDPDCDFGLPVAGCGPSETCAANDTCAACVPNCAGKNCGDDGCGGYCGACNDPAKPACVSGQCVDACSPTPAICATNDCGADGCGGSCGVCPADSQCQNGQCSAVVLPVAPTSCEGHCGSMAAAGCYCAPGCVDAGSCCADYQAKCGCAPKCAGKQCGDDGCGGSCGTCGVSAPFCAADGLCTAACTPDCKGKNCGDDGCGGSCGTCGADSSCAFTQLCIPTSWTCSTAYFGDGGVCDCGCGAPDPDCSDPKKPIFGCPSAGDLCGAAGICAVTFCGKNADCGVQWCSGTYAAGGGAIKGVCATPDALASAPGQPCFVNADCASSACVGGLCAQYCTADTDCAATQRCLGGPVSAPSTGIVAGLAGICQSVPGSATPCASQAACGSGEVCAAWSDPVSFLPRYLCTQGSAAGGASCIPGTACGGGKYCAGTPTGGVCTIACPGGKADCPSASTCTLVGFYPSKIPGFSGDPKVALCVPN